MPERPRTPRIIRSPAGKLRNGSARRRAPGVAERVRPPLVKRKRTLGPRAGLLLLVAAVAGAFLPAMPPVRAQGVDGETKQREIFVPYDDLNELLKGQTQRIFLTRDEYKQLVAKARPRQRVAPPLEAVLLSAEYDIQIDGERAVFRGRLQAEVLDEGLHAIPLQLSGVGLRSATSGEEAVALARDADGALQLILEGQGQHEIQLELVAPLATSAAQQSLRFQVPTPSAAILRVRVPGNVEVKSGAEVLQRRWDEAADQTTLELLPRQGEIVLQMTLNNRLLRRQRVVVARSVLVAEVTAGYERLHAGIALGVLHGAVDQFRFQVPDGFEITDASSPQVARWVVRPEDGGRVLELQMREPVDGDVLINIAALRSAPREGSWTFPQLQPLDALAQVAVVGLLVDEQLEINQLTPRQLIGISADVLTEALPDSVFAADPGAPRVRPVAAFYAPQSKFELNAELQQPPRAFDAMANLLMTVGNRRHELRGQFVLLPSTGKLFGFEFLVPPGWHVSKVQMAGGGAVQWEPFVDPQGGARLRVRLATPLLVGQRAELLFDAESTPAGWLSDWDEREVEFPKVVVVDAARQSGGIAVRPLDDLQVRPARQTGLTPLDESEKADFGLAGLASQLAYRYDDTEFQATFAISRAEPWITAQTYAFYHVQPNNLRVHYELDLNVQRAATDRVAFLLPESTPPSITIRGLEGVQLKEFNSEVRGDQRRWNVLLAERHAGVVRLAVDFRQRIAEDAPRQLALPPIRVEGVAYQTSLAAVEGSAELDIDVLTEGREVDVGELYNADYQIGRRLLGAFSFLGDTFDMRVDIARRPGYLLPPAIVERAELVTLATPGRRPQTAARFLLRTKAPFLELHLPSQSLWSVHLDGQGVAPQREEDKILISLPAAPSSQLRDLQVVYQGEDAIGVVDRLLVRGPKLYLRTDDGRTDREVPLADLTWRLYLPAGLQVTDTGGTVALERAPERVLPITRVLGAVAGAGRLAATESRQALRELERSRRRYDVAATEAPAGMEMEMEMNMDMSAAMPSDSKSMFESAEGLQDAPAQPQSEAAAPATPPAPTDAPREEGQPAAADEMRAAREAQAAGRARASRADAGKAAAGPPRAELWALQGVRSLDIDLTTQLAGEGYTFRSLGVEPQLTARFVDQRRIHLPAVAAGIVVLLVGITLTLHRPLTKIRYVVTVGLAALALPLLGPSSWQTTVGPVADMAFYAACLLVPYYLLAGIVRGCWVLSQRLARRWTAASLLLLSGTLFGASSAWCQQPEMPEVQSVEQLAPDAAEQWILRLLSPAPLAVPEDAIIVPYDAAEGLDGIDKAEKLLVPYRRYVELWNLAHPDRKLEAKPPRAFAVSSADYRSTLRDGDSLVVEGRLVVDVFVEQPVTIPLSVRGAVLETARLDGQPARLELAAEPAPAADANQAPQQAPAQQRAMPQALAPQGAMPQAEPSSAVPGGDRAAAEGETKFLLHATGRGRKELQLVLRYRLQRQGGWRLVEGRLPMAAANALRLQVPAAQTDVQLTGVPDRRLYETRQQQEVIATSLEDGAFAIRWRPRIAEGEVDQNLTAQSQAVLDVREDGLRLRWNLQLEFRRARRESFTLRVPDGYLVDRVVGENVRGWQAEEGDGERRLDVTLLKPATEQETLAVELSRREAIGTDATEFTAPRVDVADAVLQQGTMLIRRSPLLDVRVLQTEGAARTDVDAAGMPAEAFDESPLGLRPFQAFRFVATPFSIRFNATAYPRQVHASWETILRLAQRRSQVESRLQVRSGQRPLYELELAVPANLRIDELILPENAEWSSRVQDGQRRIYVLLKHGMTGTFSLILRGSVPRGDEPLARPLPQLQVLNADTQAASIAVQADPIFQVRAQQLQNCRTVLPSQLRSWLGADQMRLTRLAIRTTTFPYSGQLQLTEKQPQVSGFTVTNVRVTERTIEETILLDFTVREAGVQELRFLLPEWMREARIHVPMLRQKSLEELTEPAGTLPHESMVRVRLQLQEPLMGQVRVLVENDRLLSDREQEAPLVVVETGRTDQRFVTLENAGRDEVVIAQQQGLETLRKEQSDWRKLTGLLGDRLTEAYVVSGDLEAAPRLAYQTRVRATVETPTARIGLGTAELIVDTHGAYRCLQTWQVQNATEQFLEVELPEAARLWTAHVAGEPVKPTLVPGANSDRLVRIPIIKTDVGDDDYSVTLKYGGRLGTITTLGRVTFPLARTTNIRVEINQVRLRLPEEHRWFNFGGSARRVRDEEDLVAGYLEYKTRQIEKWTEALGSSNPFRRARASNNLKQLGLALQNYRELTKDHAVKESLRSQAEASLQALEAAQSRLQAQQQIDSPGMLDNRSRLNTLWMEQRNDRARNVVTDVGGNFDKAQAAGGAAPDAPQFNRGWLEKNQLQNPMDAEQLEGGARIGGKKAAPAARGKADERLDRQLLESEEARPQSAPAAEQQGQGGERRFRDQSQLALERYQATLDSVQRQSATAAPGQSRGGVTTAQSGYGGMGEMPPSANEYSDFDAAEQFDPFGRDAYGGRPGAGPPAGEMPAGPAGSGQVPEPPVQLASLDVSLPERGAEYLFTTRDEATINALAVPTRTVTRVFRLSLIAVTALVLGLCLRWLGRRRRHAA